MENRLAGQLRAVAALATALAVALLLPAQGLAHAPLLSTSPADGAELTAPPEEIVMTFDGELDPEGSRFAVSDAAGNEVGTGGVDLEVADRNEMRGTVNITEDGEYTVSWMSAAADGHPEDGTFTFTVIGDDGGDDRADTPDTAHVEDDPHPAVVLGMSLLAGCAALVLLRLRRSAV